MLRGEATVVASTGTATSSRRHRDPEHPEHADMTEGIGRPWEVNEFDLHRATRSSARLDSDSHRQEGLARTLTFQHIHELSAGHNLALTRSFCRMTGQRL